MIRFYLKKHLFSSIIVTVSIFLFLLIITTSSYSMINDNGSYDSLMSLTPKGLKALISAISNNPSTYMGLFNILIVFTTITLSIYVIFLGSRIIYEANMFVFYKKKKSTIYLKKIISNMITILLIILSIYVLFLIIFKVFNVNEKIHLTLSMISMYVTLIAIYFTSSLASLLLNKLYPISYLIPLIIYLFFVIGEYFNIKWIKLSNPLNIIALLDFNYIYMIVLIILIAILVVISIFKYKSRDITKIK